VLGWTSLAPLFRETTTFGALRGVAPILTFAARGDFDAANSIKTDILCKPTTPASEPPIELMPCSFQQ
jgi:hypothetical protein